MSESSQSERGKIGGEENPVLRLAEREDAGALVPFGRPSPTLDSPRDEPNFGSEVFGVKIDPTQISTGALAPPPNKEPEHGTRGRSSEFFFEPTWEDFEVSPEVMSVLRGAQLILDRAESVGDRHSGKRLEGHREKDPRKHSRETPSETSSPPTKRVHDGEVDPIQEDTPHFATLHMGKTGEDTHPPALSSEAGQDPHRRWANPTERLSPDVLGQDESPRDGHGEVDASGGSPQDGLDELRLGGRGRRAQDAEARGARYEVGGDAGGPCSTGLGVHADGADLINNQGMHESPGVVADPPHFLLAAACGKSPWPVRKCPTRGIGGWIDGR